ncbi:conserved exported protein of unknown function [Sterolibacterium denitrificans]|uniref:SpoOJ/ParA/ParB/repB family protein n=1 Tax=Sterolibacterium denitrificans TaxID=157592 RepID=A0A7Z7MVZ6_9PROT|nr:DUF1015 family protein [Sterolibacterium denitrificans]SMB30043.1 conserved exported protein of unknown function [Sterolibacterium denitrificans]
MPLIKPFAGLRPAAAHAAAVAAPPYDVLSTEEARARAAGKPWSFLHISKPEIDLPVGTDPYAPEVYAKALENLKTMLAEGVLKPDDQACYYAYRLKMGAHVQTGLVAAASVADYDTNRIRKHEFTRPDKEDDRVRQIEALNGQTGPVLLAYPSSAAADALLAQASNGMPDADVTADDGIQHTLWVVREAALIEKISAAFDSMPALYIADGHHRSAAASRVAAARGARGESAYFLAVIFPHHEMRIMDYNRVVTDLNGLSEDALLARIAEKFAIAPSAGQVRPTQPGEFGMYLRNRWLKLNIKPELIPAQDPVARLDVSLLSEHLLGPVLGIADLRRDKRIDFVGGIRGLDELEKRVNSGEMAVAFALHPTQMTDLMAVADAGEVMPPKSTWFEPKLADGLVSHMLD